MSNRVIKVSICVITYNNVNYIEEALRSFINQKFDETVEIIICDDASTDGTSEICRQYEKATLNLRYFQQEKNIGMMANFRFAINQCRGEYIAFCDGDDFWTDKYKVQKQYEFLERNNKFLMCASKVKVLNQIKGVLYSPLVLKSELAFKDFALNGCSGVYTCSMFFKQSSDLIKKINQSWFLGLDGADHFLLLFYTLNGEKIKILDEEMAVYRVHNNGVWTTKKSIDRLNGTKKNNKLYIDNLKGDLKTRLYFKVAFIREKHSYKLKEMKSNNYYSRKIIGAKYRLFRLVIFIVIKTLRR
jgi:glycosyltransferase involved in cell wall biosynthesis